MLDAKRLPDLSVGVPLLVLSLPVQAAVALLIRVRLGSPVLFRQQRPGLNGVPFEMVKFRTMVALDPLSGLVTDDQRIPPMGALLRSTSLDELPALLQAVRGEMSLVGPRPLLVRYLDQYSAEQARRYEVRPGQPGLAQINGRNATTWDRRLALDVEYVETRSLRLDLKILWRTLVIVLHRRGVSSEGTATMPEFRPPRSEQVRETARHHPPRRVRARGRRDQRSEAHLGAGGCARRRTIGGQYGGNARHGDRMIGAIRDLPALDAQAVLAIGSPTIPATIDADLPDARSAVLVHLEGTFGSNAVLGVCTVIAPPARLSTKPRGERHRHVDQNVAVAYVGLLGDHVRLDSEACVSGPVTLVDRMVVTASAVILAGHTLGRDVVVDAAVTKDVPDGAVVKGVPAR